MVTEFGHVEFGLDGGAGLEDNLIDDIRKKLDKVEEKLDDEEVSEDPSDDETPQEQHFKEVDKVLGEKGKKNAKDDDSEEVDEESLTASKEELERLGIALEWLRDLHYTIGREGVSSADMKALGEIRQRLMTQGVELLPAPALESYQMGLYLPTRSSVNLSAAQESFSTTMIQTVKRWIANVINYVSKLITWALKEFTGETKDQRDLDGLKKRYEAIQHYRTKLESRVPTQSYIRTRLTTHAGDLLTANYIERNRLTVAAFFSINDDKILTKHFTSAITAAKSMVEELENLRKDLEQDSEELSFSDRELTLLGLQVVELEEYIKTQPQASYVVNQVRPSVFEATPKAHTFTATAYNELIEQYAEIRKRLKQIRKIERRENIEGVVDNLNGFMQALGHISSIAQAAKKYNATKKLVLRQFISYENAHLSLLVKEGLANADKYSKDYIDELVEEAKREVAGIDGVV